MYLYCLRNAKYCLFLIVQQKNHFSNPSGINMIIEIIDFLSAIIKQLKYKRVMNYLIKCTLHLHVTGDILLLQENSSHYVHHSIQTFQLVRQGESESLGLSLPHITKLLRVYVFINLKVIKCLIELIYSGTIYMKLELN